MSSKEKTKNDDASDRAGWDNKLQYILAQIGFAVNLNFDVLMHLRYLIIPIRDNPKQCL